ncbi:hypothetical protein DFH09DRAFT_1340060 [Mycena vulgaris]|nr:hypothetical protein DFH09DRAFT_1340060 [Mycena vulgaris]
MADSFQCRARLHRIPDPQDQASEGLATLSANSPPFPFQSVQFDGRCRRRATLFKPMPLSTPNSRLVVHPQLVGPSAAPPIRMPRPRESLTTTNPPQMKFLGQADPSKTDRAPLARSRSLHPRFPPPSRPECTRFSADLVLAARASVFVLRACLDPAGRRLSALLHQALRRIARPPSSHTHGLLGLAALVPAAVRDDAMWMWRWGWDVSAEEKGEGTCDWYQVRDLYARRIPNLPGHVSIRRARAMLRTSTSDSARLASDEPIPPLYPVRCAYAVREEQWRTGVLVFKVTRE